MRKSEWLLRAYRNLVYNNDEKHSRSESLDLYLRFFHAPWLYAASDPLDLPIMNVARRSQRRGHGRRGPLLPPEVPRWQSRSEAFDQAVLDAYAPLNDRWREELIHLDVAIDTVPRMKLRADALFPEEIVGDGPVPLGRYISAGIDHQGKPTRPCLVIFRRPIERRASNRLELDELLRHVLARLIAAYLGISPFDVDPAFDEEYL